MASWRNRCAWRRKHKLPLLWEALIRLFAATFIRYLPKAAKGIAAEYLVFESARGLRHRHRTRFDPFLTAAFLTPDH